MKNPNENLPLPALSIDLYESWVAAQKPELLLTYDAVTQTFCESIWRDGDLLRSQLVAPVSEAAFRKLANDTPGATGHGSIARDGGESEA